MTSPHSIQAEAPDQYNRVLGEADFELIYREYAPFLLRVCHALCKDETLAADMVQEIFCAIWDRRANLSVKGPWENYLYRCAKYQFYNHQRSLNRLDRVKSDILADSDSGDNTTQLQIDYRDLNRNIDGLVEQLPDQCRKVFQMSRKQGLKTTEISKELLLSEKTVKNHLTRALGFLRRNVEALLSLSLLLV